MVENQSDADPGPASTVSESGDGSNAPDTGSGPVAPTGIRADPPTIGELTEAIVKALKSVYDPEIPVDVYELGLIYRVDLSDDIVENNRDAVVEMTLTAPGCPVADWIVAQIHGAVQGVEGIGHVNVQLVFDPPWDVSLMSDEARFALNMM